MWGLGLQLSKEIKYLPCKHMELRSIFRARAKTCKKKNQIKIVSDTYLQFQCWVKTSIFLRLTDQLVSSTRLFQDSERYDNTKGWHLKKDTRGCPLVFTLWHTYVHLYILMHLHVHTHTTVEFSRGVFNTHAWLLTGYIA